MSRTFTFSKNPHLLAKSIHYTATFAGREHTLTATQWMHMLNTTHSTIQRGLIKHHSMQALIEKQFAVQSRIGELWYRLTFKKPLSNQAEVNG